MATTVEIAVDDAPESVAFPEQCVGCGGARHPASKLAFSQVVTNAHGGQAPARRTLAVPHCEACARMTKAVFLAGLIPFVVGFLSAGIVSTVTLTFARDDIAAAFAAANPLRLRG